MKLRSAGHFYVRTLGTATVTPSEFAIIIVWVLLPPVLLATAVLIGLHRKNAGRLVGRTVGAVLILVVASVCIALGLVVAGPPSLGRFIGIRDAPIMWTPFAFISVAIALPFAIWWASRGSRS